ncbi:MAG: 2-oxoglutarate oxidoreductase [Deltaproteobacteria bacterium]|nr:2-oxoglutarate oxidoreductase [Deltaproteobacteria bacterium]
MKQIFSHTKGMIKDPMHYCPGCTHGIIHRLVSDALVDLDLLDTAVGVSSVGCSVFTYKYFKCDMFQAAHGRAPAVATGAKRGRPDLTVFTYQGDGDLAAIGTSEVIHAANRGEKITVIFANNAIYGMTGGQMAPTTIPGQRTSTTPNGRDVESDGFPLMMSEILSVLKTPGYIARVSMHSPKEIIKAKEIVKKAFTYQRDNVCFSFVEFLSTCPTNWGMSPSASQKWIETDMLPHYKLGELKVPDNQLVINSLKSSSTNGDAI